MTRQEILAVAKPILFNTDMVRAILEGRKTVTRRAMKAQLPENVVELREVNPLGYLSFRTTDKLLDGWGNRKAQYEPGQTLYVRETAMIQSMKNYEKAVKLLFKADDNLEQFSVSDEFYDKLLHYPQNKWLSPYWFTKEAARIFLRVTDVRRERLQEITEEQAKAEGCITFSDKSGDGKFDDVMEFDLTARDAFVELWNGTLKKDSACTWAHNPWVWVYEFERLEAQA